MTRSCTRDYSFCSGHRVLDHESKCAHPHGHNYRVEITATSEKLDSLGRIIDFSVLKEKIGGWIESNWDHGFIVFSEDGDLIKALSTVPDNKLFILPTNPTVENLCSYLLTEVCPVVLKGSDVTVTRVLIHETENCRAEATL